MYNKLIKKPVKNAFIYHTAVQKVYLLKILKQEYLQYICKSYSSYSAIKRVI